VSAIQKENGFIRPKRGLLLSKAKLKLSFTMEREDLSNFLRRMLVDLFQIN